MDPQERTELERRARKPLAERILSALGEAGYGRGKASELARALGVTPNTVYRIRRGSFAPSIFTLASIAKITGKPMEWFVEDFQHPPVAVFHEWKRARSTAPPALVAQLETVDVEGLRATPAFYDVALAALSAGSSLERAVAAARAVLLDV